MGVADAAVEVAGDDLVEIEFVASGGSGSVYRAVQRSLGRTVALKVLHGVDLREDRAQREARVQAQVSSHANVVTLFGTTTVNGSSPALIMEFVPGGSLADRIRRSGPLELADWVQAGQEVSSALTAAHDLGIIHRDVKPSNVLFAADGSTRLGDFGISGTGTRTLEQLEASVAFAAPELLEGDQPALPNDVYSLALTLLVAALGRHPFGEDVPVAAMAARIQSERVRFTDWVPDVPAELGVALDRSLDLEPDDRPTISELHAVFVDLGHTRGTPAPDRAEPGEVLSVRGLTLVDDRFGFEQKLLDSVSFHVGAGEVLALVGHIDSGARLALEVSGGHRRFASGAVTVSRRQANPAEPRSNGWAYVAPEPQVFPTLTVRSNLDYFAGLGAARRREARERVDSVVDTMLLREFVSVKASQLTPLCAQRLHLAIAMVSDPSVVLIDWIGLKGEPGLRDELVRSLDVMVQRRLGVIVGTDDPLLASRVAGRFCIMSKGRVVARGSKESLASAYGDRDALVIVNNSAIAAVAASLDVREVHHLDGDWAQLRVGIPDHATVDSVLGGLPVEGRAAVVSIELRTPSFAGLLDRLMDGLGPSGRPLLGGG